ncbi:EamA-like transporter family protein [Hyphomicrobium facile]|uniref:EamA-like transporter family protein n=1 Tax=Hyphomicrobium facile TaxID=51670 RepID=A0A1I7NQ11_9HYPH|nr:EamA-like transporter family protein [Hyphomicrobium facile]
MGNASRLRWGLLYAFIACMFWSSLYVRTDFVAPYGTADLAIVRFSFSTLIAMLILLARGGLRRIFNERTRGEWLLASALGFLGFTGYYFFLATAIKYTSEVITVAIIAMISVVTLLVNNALYREFKWHVVAWPALLGGAGVATIVWGQVQAGAFSFTDKGMKGLIGLAAALVALAMWSAYQVLNKRALIRFSAVSVEDWTLLTLIGGAIALPPLLAILPASPMSEEFTLYSQPLGPSTLPLLGWGLFLAIGASLLSLSSWNRAQKYLPPTLSGQSVVFLLPLVFALGWYYGRFSTNAFAMLTGIGLLFLSVGATIILQHSPKWLPKSFRSNARRASNADSV